MLMGKKHYMSPEQILGLAVDARSDVFSMGVVLYELLSLEPLFTEDVTQLAIDEVAIHPIPSIRAHIPNIDADLERIINAALSKDPRHRPTAAAMGRTLDDWCSSQQQLGTPDRLQEHLARLFPASYQPQSVSAEYEKTTFSNLARSVRNGPQHERGILARLFGR
jgi:serine/threonine protein kinase